MKQSPVKYFIIAGVGIFILLIIIFLLLSAKNKKFLIGKIQPLIINLTPAEENKIKVSPVEEQKKKEYLQIAGNVLKWLDTMKDENGVYMDGPICKENKKCNNPVKENRVGLNVIWGRFKYYEQTKDKKDLDILTQDLSTYAEKVKVIQNDFWDCRIMYQLWQSNLLTDSAKNLAKKICLRGEPDTTAMIKGTEAILKNNVQLVDLDKVKNGKIIPLELPERYFQLISYSTTASDFVTKYMWFKDNVTLNNAYLKRAILFFNYAVEAYSSERTNKKNPDDDWYLAIAALDLYKASNDNKYLDFAKFILGEKDLGSNSCSTLSDCVGASFFFDIYKPFIKEDEDNKQKEFITKIIINRGYDYKGYNPYFLGKGAFRTFNLGDTYYSTKENGLLVGLFSSK